MNEPVCSACGYPLHTISGEQIGDDWVNHLGCTNSNYDGTGKPCPLNGVQQYDSKTSFEKVVE